LSRWVVITENLEVVKTEIMRPQRQGFAKALHRLRSLDHGLSPPLTRDLGGTRPPVAFQIDYVPDYISDRPLQRLDWPDHFST